MRIPPLPLAAALLTSLAHTAQADTTVPVRVLGQESIPPKWVLRDGRAEGVCPDILAAMEKAEPRLRFTGLDDLRSVPVIEQGLETGRVAAACGLLDSERRRRIALQAGKLYVVRHRLAAAINDKVSVETMDDLVRLKPLIATSRGAAYSEQLRKLGLHVDDSTGDNLTNLKKIIAGHGRFMYMNELTLGWIIRRHKLQDKVYILPTVMKEEPIYFWISKKTDPDTARLMTQALQKLAAKGELARIYERWATALP
ncbi:substrate-binding periplasmic protein [Pseudoduganella namucuonensis]|uniref:Glutamate/aspartate transport system substrate-binding protein n=1 Tax=Pseudoduganella namucuonensis TaxID=1035707 RepID=A0A1I7GT78_9BURK|nr:transporter substrate-binding domain-containing protein [Pseudoduganella namucuonensis]SFU51658.1 glutamate/aspartate transport system substrate-binding protein [Pseudoduganella namucuonensis]